MVNSMKIIVDTHIYLWALSQPEKLSKKFVDKLKDKRNTIFVSSISIAEIAIKSSIGKLTINFDPVEMVKLMGFESLDFSALDAIHLKDLPFHHKDPFDRMLISQCINNQYHLMSDDSKFKFYNCSLV